MSRNPHGPWFRVYTSVLNNRKILKLNDAQFAGYIRLGAVATDNGGIIPSDLGDIAKQLRKPEGKVRELMQVLISVNLMEQTPEGFIIHDWEEMQFQSDVSTNRVRAFRQRQRNGDGNNNETFLKRPHSTETENREQSPPIAPQGGKSTRGQKPAREKRFLNGHAQEFEEFWRVYPKRVQRGKAEKAYLKALKLADAATILAGAKRYAELRKPEDPTYTAYASSWLNGKGWLDDFTVQDENAPDPKLQAMLEAEAEHRRKHGEIE